MTDNIREKERTFLGCLLGARPGELPALSIKSHFFDDPVNGRIYQAYCKQRKEGTAPSILTLTGDSDLADIGDAYIAGLTNYSPPAINIPHYESEIIQAYKKRTFKQALERALEKIRADGYAGDVDPIIREFMALMAGAMNDKNERSIKTAGELLAAEYPPINWIFKGLIGEGLTMLNGAPKIGKSWFVLGAALAASQGGCFLGSAGYQPQEPIETLYISLEDTERRLSDRLKKLNANTRNDKLRITTTWKDNTQGLDNYLVENPDTGFVIIDTLGRFIGPGLDDMNDYAATVNAISRIKKIADSRETAILIVHHARKGGNSEKDSGDWMDAALGSAGIAGSADASIFITKPRPKSGKDKAPELWATGRDAGDIHHVLKFDADCGWTIDSTPRQGNKELAKGKTGTGTNFDWSKV
ncbi:MAG: AAA family ATPase [Spirochaetaceae bacterium]|jgi:hypothetical protein|nr:AAA family ATPase [Spirochaetaceae bacterium]